MKNRLLSVSLLASVALTVTSLCSSLAVASECLIQGEVDLVMEMGASRITGWIDNTAVSWRVFNGQVYGELKGKSFALFLEDDHIFSDDVYGQEIDWFGRSVGGEVAWRLYERCE